VEYRLRTKSGDYRWFIARGQAQWDANGNPTRFSGSIRDITKK
jgi:PAS domain S-box-containing protein